MSTDEEAIEKFALVCLCVANMMDEEGLSVEDTLKALRQLMPLNSPAIVSDAMKRLECSFDEAALSRCLIAEAEQANRVLATRRNWPKSLFG